MPYASEQASRLPARHPRGSPENSYVNQTSTRLVPEAGGSLVQVPKMHGDGPGYSQ